MPIVGDDHPYVVKSPWSYQFIRELLARPDIKLDGVLLPVRDLAEAAASRVILELRNRYEHNYGFASRVKINWRDLGNDGWRGKLLSRTFGSSAHSCAFATPNHTDHCSIRRFPSIF